MKLLTSLLFLLTLHVHASGQHTLSKEALVKQNQALLAKAGIELLNFNEINIVSAQKYRNDPDMAKRMNEYLAMKQEQDKNGYVIAPEPRAKELIELKHTAPYQQKKYKGVLSSKSTHMRASIEELKLAYTFVGVPPEEMDHPIGVAPYGAYRAMNNGDVENGWDGAVQFFDKNSVGSCAFTEHNRKLAQSGVELIKELVSYDVQNKPTILLVKGMKATGFVYKLKWYGPIFTRELACANLSYSQEILDNVISLANRIENYQQPGLSQ